MIIDVELNDKSIDAAISDIKKYKERLLKGTKTLVDELSREVENKAYVELTRHIWSGETIASLHTEQRKDTKYTNSAKVRVGGAAVWLEFGTGVVANNCSPGTILHPVHQIDDSGLLISGIGMYGQRHGSDPNGWYWEDEYGESHHTFGIPATMFMWRAAQSARQRMPSIARRVLIR